MQQLLEFVNNHPFLFAMLAAVITFIIITELRRKSGPGGVSAKEAVRLINDEDAIILDVRDTPEYKTSHILNAKNIPFAQLEEQAPEIIKNKKSPVIAYCKSGNISPSACNKLKTMGYENVSYLKSGLFAWQDESLPMVRA